MSDDVDLAPYVDLSRAIKVAWAAALRLTGCMGCARLEIEQNLAAEAYATQQWMLGEHADPSPALIPLHREGIYRMCRKCLGSAQA